MKWLVGGLIAVIIAVGAGGGYETLHLQRQVQQEQKAVLQLNRQIEADRMTIQSLIRMADKSVPSGTGNNAGSTSSSSTGSTNSTTSNTTSPPASNTTGTTTQVAPSLKVSNVQVVRNSSGVFVTGIVSNSGGVANLVVVDATVYGKNGAVLGTGTYLISQIGGGQQVAFQTLVSGISANASIGHADATANSG